MGMPDSQDISVYEHSHALVAVHSRPGIDAAAIAVSTTYGIHLKRLLIAMPSVSGAEAHFQKGGVRTVDVL